MRKIMMVGAFAAMMSTSATAQETPAQISNIPELLEAGYEIVTMTSTKVDKYASPGQERLSIIMNNDAGDHYLCQIVADSNSKVGAHICAYLGPSSPNQAE